MELTEILFINTNIERLEKELINIRKEIEKYKSKSDQKQFINRDKERIYVEAQIDMLQLIRLTFYV